MKNAVTLFSGLGSSSKALRDLGYDVIAHDIMPEACQTLIANGFDLVRKGDVRDVNFSSSLYADTDVVVGGPPCQPFSQAHTGDGQYDPRDMIPEFIRAVRTLVPRLFVMEEVKTLTWDRHAAYLARVEDELRSAGYVVEHRVLDASDYFIPQARKRLFIVGRRRDVAEHDFDIDNNRFIRWPRKGDTKLTMAQALDWDSYEAEHRNLLAPVQAHDAAKAQWVYERPSTTVVGSFRPDVQAAPGYRRAGDGPRQNTPGSVVTTQAERLRLQDMPTDWVVKGSTSKQDLQIGNSVPCGLIREIVQINA